jgi:hypothetical protein
VYWKQVHIEAWRRTRQAGFLEWKRLSTSLGVPILSFLAQWVAGVPITTNIIVNLTVGVCLYIFLIFVERYIRTREVVVEWHKTQQATISERDQRIAELTGPRPAPYRAHILQLNLNPASYDSVLSVLAFSFLVEIRNLSDLDTSIHRIQLCFLDSSGSLESSTVSISRPLAHGRIWKERLQAAFPQMDKETAMRALSKGSRWKISFMDTHDNKYESEILKKP